jgi:hypothetical protein
MHFLKIAYQIQTVDQIQIVDQIHLFVVVADQIHLCRWKGIQLDYLIVQKHSVGAAVVAVAVAVVAVAAAVATVVELLWIVLVSGDSLLIQWRGFVRMERLVLAYLDRLD